MAGNAQRSTSMGDADMKLAKLAALEQVLSMQKAFMADLQRKVQPHNGEEINDVYKSAVNDVESQIKFTRINIANLSIELYGDNDFNPHLLWKY